MLQKVLFSLFLLFSFFSANAYQLRGTVLDDEKNPLPAVSIYIKQSTYGVISNAKGEFLMELDGGEKTLIFSCMGFEKQELTILIPYQKHLTVVLKTQVTELAEIAISAKRKDPAYEFMKLASENRQKHLQSITSLKMEAYIKASLEKEELNKERDSITNEKIKITSKEKMNLVEKYSQLIYQVPNNKKEVVLAFKNYSDEPEVLDIGSSLANYGFYIDQAENYDVAVEYEANPLLFYLHPLEIDLNLYQSHVQIDELNEMPFISPLHPLATASYNFKLLESFNENNQIIYKIGIEPKRSAEALFSGHIFLVDQEWAIKAVNLSVSSKATGIFSKMQFVQNFAKNENGIWLCQREEFFYEAEDENITYIGNTIAMYNNFEINTSIDKKTFNGQLSETQIDALENATVLLEKLRPITLKTEEIGFIQTQDSIYAAHSSAEYLLSVDSSFNHTNLLDVLLFGVENQNSSKGRYIYFLPVVDQLRLFQPGGYRHALGGSYSKFYKETGRQFDTYSQIDYGLLNNDLRGHFKSAYTFNSFNFSKILAGFGSEYELMNQNQSVISNLSPGNYNLVNHLTLGYDREYFNGFYVNTELRYAKHSPITSLEIPPFMDSVVLVYQTYFSDLLSSNFNPIYFEPYTKLMLDFDIALRFKQKYRTTPNRKVIMGSKYPKVNIRIKTGIPRILNSVSSFGYAEIRVQDVVKMGSYGYSQYNVLAGSFLWKNALQLVDEKFFIGGDFVWFTNPLRGQQLLGQSLRTNGSFFEYHYRHNFDGTIMNKIPLLRSLRLGITLGSNALYLPNTNFKHIETYYGIEKKFRIATELMKFGVYVLNGTNSDIPFTTDFRLGLSYYNPISKSWN